MKRKKSNKFQLLISSAALLLILLVAAGVTYSWIEGGVTYSIKTNNSGDVKTGTAPGEVKNSLTLDPGAGENSTIDLNEIDKTTNKEQGLYFSEVSSSDGENFFFPTYVDGGAIKYRPANTNDIGTKFIKFDFDVKALQDCSLVFEETPKIVITAKDGSIISDTSAFRIMLKCGDERYIFTTADSVQTSKAVTDTQGNTTDLVANPVSGYVYGSTDTKKIFKLSKDAEKKIVISVWLDADSAGSELIGAKVDLDMKLKVENLRVNVRVYVAPRDYSSYYGYVHNETPKYEFGGWAGKEMEYDTNTGYYCVKGVLSENAYFIVNDSSGTQYPTKDTDCKQLPIDIFEQADDDGYVSYLLKNDNSWSRFTKQ